MPVPEPVSRDDLTVYLDEYLRIAEIQGQINEFYESKERADPVDYSEVEPLYAELNASKEALAAVSDDEPCRRQTLQSQAVLYEKRNRECIGDTNDD